MQSATVPKDGKLAQEKQELACAALGGGAAR